jgi:sugar lactone lactonase YvrE
MQRTTALFTLLVLVGFIGAGQLEGCGTDAATAVAALDNAEPTQLRLPGDQFFPESINATPDGTLYVSSIATGQIVKFERGSSTSTPFLRGGDPKGVTGILPDVATSTLFVCAVDFSVMPPATELRAYDLRTAVSKQTYAFSTVAFCNDMVLDPSGGLYVSDSFGKIWKLPNGGAELEVWSADPLLAPPMPGTFGANGIALDPRGHVYVANTFTNTLVRISINPDGSASAATAITLSMPIAFPDGLRLVNPNTLVLVEALSGKLTKVALSRTNGIVSNLSSGLNQPSSLIRVGASWWVTEGQILTLFGVVNGTLTLPFDIKRVDAF